METILNRLRGTGNIYKFITGTMLYALYLGLLVGILSNWYYGLIAIALFLFGESFGWGKWVGFLVSNNRVIDYDNYEGRNFPFIHYLANFFIKEKKDYLNYCRLALTIRGFIWWTPLLILLGFVNLLDWYQVAINSILLAVGFPLASELSRIWHFEYKSKYLSVVGSWEKQEIIYGFIQFLCVSLSVFLFAIIK